MSTMACSQPLASKSSQMLSASWKIRSESRLSTQYRHAARRSSRSASIVLEGGIAVRLGKRRPALLGQFGVVHGVRFPHRG